MSDPQPLTYTAADGYLTLPVDVDADRLAADQLDFIAAQLPGFTPTEGHLEVLLIEAFAAMAAETAAVAASVPLSIFGYFGSKLLGIMPQAGVSATVASTWTMVDSRGYTIPAGTVVAFAPTGDQMILFTVVTDVTVAAGASSTAVGAVQLQAVTAGVAGNGLAGPPVLVDPLAFVQAITTATLTAGGVDAETGTAYLGRLSLQLQLLTPRPILPTDFARLATQTVGVTRALGIDGLNPARTFTDGATTSGSTTVTSPAQARFVTADVGRGISGPGIPAGATIASYVSATSITISSAATATASGLTITLARATGQARTVAVAGIDALGASLSSTVKAALQANLSALREINFVVNTIDPTVSGIDVTYTAVASPGANPTAVLAATNAALSSFLSPAAWAGGTLTPPVWQPGQTMVRYLDVANVIRSVPGVAYISNLQIALHGNALGTADLTLTGDAPLPSVAAGVGAVSGNVTS